jgi:hypothetical protein
MLSSSPTSTVTPRSLSAKTPLKSLKPAEHRDGPTARRLGIIFLKII